MLVTLPPVDPVAVANYTRADRVCHMTHDISVITIGHDINTNVNTMTRDISVVLRTIAGSFDTSPDHISATCLHSLTLDTRHTPSH